MIPIDRPAAPNVLTRQGKQRAKTHCKNYDKEEAAYCSGAKVFPFDHRIYAHETVKSTLIAMQHGKCCYCEKRIGDAGDVEHFRPKGSVCQDENSTELIPGYYWLAYDWDNLLYACKECNQLHKGTRFPLTDPATRVRSHKNADTLSQEVCLLINPARTDATLLLSFREEFAYSVGGNASASETIRVCGLNRKELTNRRAERVQSLRDCLCVLRLKDQLSDQMEGRLLVAMAERTIAEASLPTSEFLAMVRAIFIVRESVSSSTIQILDEPGG